MEVRNVYENQIDRINPIKEQLMNIAAILEENGYIRKSKSLYTIVGRLEQWQHTDGKRKG